jgi:class 3 adenylate cyclase
LRFRGDVTAFRLGPRLRAFSYEQVPGSREPVGSTDRFNGAPRFVRAHSLRDNPDVTERQAGAEQLAAATLQLERGDCSGALEALEALYDRGLLPPAGHEALARAAWLCGDIDKCLVAFERAFRGYLRESNTQRAGFVALMLSWEHAGLLAIARAEGWMRRAERLLADCPECSELGYLEWFRGRALLGNGDLDSAREHFDRASVLAVRFTDSDLEALARWYGGFGLLSAGEAKEGFALIDEAMAAASGGELSAYFAGFIYCITVTACCELGDYRRAAEWTEAQRRWCEQTKVAVYPSVCRINRAAVLGMSGVWLEAEEEAASACRELEQLGLLAGAGEAYYELGSLLVRRGDQAGAEQALSRAYELGRSPQPALAELRLLQGRTEEARALLERAVAETGSDQIRVARLLPLLVEAALAQGDVEGARSTYQRLESAAFAAALPFVQAMLETARGRLALADGDSATAAEALRRALRLWRDEVQAPYEAARAQLVLAEAVLAGQDLSAAALEAGAALATFERMGATRDAEAARKLLRRLEPCDEAAVARRVRRTFVFTDLVRSTQLVEAIGDDAWHHLLAWHDTNLRSLFAAHGGEEVDHAGDGFFVAFPDSSTAIACSVAIQNALVEHRRESGFAPDLRIGIHSAETTSHDEGYRGRGVHVAARIAAHATAGEILVSRKTADGLADTYQLEDRGDVALKGIEKPIAVVAVRWLEVVSDSGTTRLRR